MFDFKDPKFTNPEAAREYLEGIRWPNGPVCPHCGDMERVMLLKGKATRPGLYKCGECRKQFTVTVGTVFERSKISIEKWVLATHRLCSSKKGFSAHQLHRMMGVTYKTAWFMCHRIREAMREGGPGLLGGGGKTVEIDETFWGGSGKAARKAGKVRRGYQHKEKILTLVERDGRARSFHVPAVNAKTLLPIIKQQVAADTHVMTDEAGQYTNRNQFGRVSNYLEGDFASHQVVQHGIGEYVRGDVHTNTIEGYFSILKRGLNGTYQHCSKEHLKRYIGEFDFRYNYREKLGFDDSARTRQALKGIEGKRLTYLPINAQ